MTEKMLNTFILRHPTREDAQAITDLIIAADIAETGQSDFTGEDLRSDWEKPDFALEKDAWVTVNLSRDGIEKSDSPEPVVIGYEELWNHHGHHRLLGDGYVHPDYTGLGVGTALLHALEARAREHARLAPPDHPVSVRNGMYGTDRAARALHENEGYRPARYYWRMRLEMGSPPPKPEWPLGIQAREFVPDQDERATFEAVDEAFQTSWGYVPDNFEAWKQHNLRSDQFNASLWFLAQDREQVAGVALCRYRQETGWVNQLAVRSAWRRRGLGIALLYHAFGEFWRRGTRIVELGVDASNPTGATRLYQRAGMQVAIEFVVYEKEIHPALGVD